ncbi:MAG: fumarate hydratase C-terminal domain-containing protein [Thermoplasmata archaeon]|nr:fumarate hydratase C-terminal domain-containing protein [Thermoplasmata archaeon]
MIELNKTYHISLSIKDAREFHVDDIIFLSGKIFTARDKAHKKILSIEEIPFNPKDMALFHCGPLMKKNKNGWKVISAGPTTSSRMESFEADIIRKLGIKIIIGKGGMGEKTLKALKKYSCVYLAYPGGAGALAADKVEKVEDVYWLEELGILEAVWIFKVKDFGPLVIAMDSHGKTLYPK